MTFTAPSPNGKQGPSVTLRSGALSFPEVLMQGISHIAPAVGIILSLQFLTGLAGVTAPLAFLFGFFVILMLGISLTQLAKHLPSAGGYYYYVSRTVHPNAGFLTAWIYFLYDPALTAINVAFMGYFVERMMRAEYGWWCPWWLFFLASTALITVLVFRGVGISTSTTMLLGLGEVAIVLALGISGLVHPGPGGINLHSYAPHRAPSINGLYLAVVFSIFVFTGFEGVAPLAEESEHPRRNLPRAIIGSIVLMGAFYLFCSWTLLIGWGTDAIASLNHSAENPWFVLARRFWGRGWILIFIAVINSVIAVSISCTNASTRVIFAMSRAGALPRRLRAIHPRFRTPVNAIGVQTLLTLSIGLGLGFLIGPDQEFYFMGVVMTLGLALVYGAGNYGVYRFYSRERPAEFRFFLHLFCPAISTCLMLWVGIKSIVPLPPGVLRYAPFLVGVWIALGIGLVTWMNHHKKSSVTFAANAAQLESLPAVALNDES
jgi:amino acid transporter